MRARRRATTMLCSKMHPPELARCVGGATAKMGTSVRVVDDDEDLLHQLARSLSEHGSEVHHDVVLSFGTALALLSSGR